jgi:hypothetical protein
MIVQGHISEDKFSYIVRCAPLPSLDLIIRDSDDRVLVGLRTNEPAKNYYFVPGGVIRKNESIELAFARILRAETVAAPVSVMRGSWWKASISPDLVRIAGCGVSPATSVVPPPASLTLTLR